MGTTGAGLLARGCGCGMGCWGGAAVCRGGGAKPRGGDSRPGSGRCGEGQGVGVDGARGVVGWWPWRSGGGAVGRGSGAGRGRAGPSNIPLAAQSTALLGGQVPGIHKDSRAAGGGAAVAEQEEDAVDHVLHLCGGWRAGSARLGPAVWARPPQPRPPLHEAQLTCKLPQRVALLQLPGELGVRQGLLAHGGQHHRGVYRVHPDLGPRGRRGCLSRRTNPALTDPTELAYSPPGAPLPPFSSPAPPHPHPAPTSCLPSPGPLAPTAPPCLPCAAPAPWPWLWSGWSFHPWWSLWEEGSTEDP